MANAQDHRDNRGVFIRLWVLDLVDGDFPAAMLLSQLLWWAQPSTDGEARMKYKRDGHRWLVRSDDDWRDECRLSARQVGEAKRRLKKAGFIEVKRVKWGVGVSSALRPLLPAIRAAALTGSEYTRSREIGGFSAIASFQNDAIGALHGIDAIASIPNEESTAEKEVGDGPQQNEGDEPEGARSAREDPGVGGQEPDPAVKAQAAMVRAVRDSIRPADTDGGKRVAS